MERKPTTRLAALVLMLPWALSGAADDPVYRKLTIGHPEVAALLREHPRILEILHEPMWSEVVLRAPQIPGTPWQVHDLRRPQPPIVVPDTQECRDQVAPPSDAVVIFDGHDLSGFAIEARGLWNVRNGELVASAGKANRLATRESFGDVQLHLEFATPDPPTGQWQFRGNSGVFLMGRYEIQILDSFDNPTYPDGQAAALYGQIPPLVNASRPPGAWQCYDLLFKAPRFSADRLLEPARVTLRYNGVLVQDAAAFLGSTEFAKLGVYQPHASRLPITLQAHGDAGAQVRFRNIWARRLDPGAAPSSTVVPAKGETAAFISVDAPVFAVRHVRVIDGNGNAPLDDQTIVVAGGRIQSIGPAASTPVPAGAVVFDRTGKTAIPGLIGMHDHLFYTNSLSTQLRSQGGIDQPGLILGAIPFSAPRLYLAAGVTTLRTTGSLDPYGDLKVKHRIEQGLMVGPGIDATAPYLEGPHTGFVQMHELTDATDARRLVEYWAQEGMTSFKAYTNITRAELAAAIEAAHARHHKITGHLCSVTWREAIALGIDNLEHGPVFTDSGFVADKKPDVCPSGSARDASWAGIDIAGPQARALIADLVKHGVAVTSTLAVFEAMVPSRPALQQRVLDAMAPEAARSYLTARARIGGDSTMAGKLRKEMEFEKAFVLAGGLLLVGSDPTGNGGVLPGFGTQRAIELLVEAGLTPVQAIQVATSNGARFLGRERLVGTLEAGKQADFVLLAGDPSRDIAALESVAAVFKDGVGYDPSRLVESIRGQVGIR